MSDSSTIEWTDATWNPVRGCVKVSPGCAHCYAETFAERFRGVKGHAYEQGFDLRLVPEKLDEPLRWKQPRRVFVNSMSDLFQTGVPDEFIDRVFAVMALARRHTFQVLTKRSGRMWKYTAAVAALDVKARARRMLTAMYKDHPARRLVLDNLHDAHLGPFPWPVPNVWLGVSVENQAHLHRVDTLKDIAAAVRFVSFEPLLESLGALFLDGVEWVIVGGESGHGARPFDIAWARTIISQCRAAGVPVFVKQLGAMPIAGRMPHPDDMFIRLRSRKGGDMSEWPEDLRVREFPEARA